MAIGPNGVVAIVSVLAVLGTVGVAARFLVRWMKKTKYGWDDWFILFSMFMMWAIAAVMLRGAVMNYFGSHTAIDPVTGKNILKPKDRLLVKYQYVVWLLSICGLTFIKISIILLYRRIFQVQRWFDIYSKVIIVVIACWGISFLFATVFQCGTRPWVYWTSVKLYPLYCVDPNKVAVGSMIADVLTDLLVLLPPVPMIWKLDLTRIERIGLVGIFFLGFLATAAGIARAALIAETLYNTHAGARDIAQVDTTIVVWCIVEIGVAVLAACLITLRPLFVGKSPESLIGSIRSALSIGSGGSHGSRNARTQPAQDDSVALKTNDIELGSMRGSESRSGEGGERAYSEVDHNRQENNGGNHT